MNLNNPPEAPPPPFSLYGSAVHLMLAFLCRQFSIPFLTCLPVSQAFQVWSLIFFSVNRAPTAPDTIFLVNLQLPPPPFFLETFSQCDLGINFRPFSRPFLILVRFPQNFSPPAAAPSCLIHIAYFAGLATLFFFSPARFFFNGYNRDSPHSPPRFPSSPFC